MSTAMYDEESKVETTVEETVDEMPQINVEDSEAEDVDFEDDEDVESEDSLTFSNGVIEKIVALAMSDVPGVVGMKGGFVNRLQDAFGVRDARKGVTVEVTPDSSVRVNLSVFIAYGSYAPQIFEDVKHAVENAVTGMTGLEVAGVNLRIEDVLTPEEIAERTPKLPEPEDEETEALPEAVEPEDEVETDEEVAE